jgi:thiol-disulfide isomerase/thioredoxin
MKKAIFITILIALATLSVRAQQHNLVAKIDGWEKCDSVWVYTHLPDGSRVDEKIPLHNGGFNYDIQGEVPVKLVVSVPNEDNKGYILGSTVIETFIAPADRVKIEGRVSEDGVLHYEATGSALAAEINRLRKESLPSLAREDSLQRWLIIAQYEGLPKGEENRIFEEQRRLYIARTKAEIATMQQFIRANPDAAASAYYITRLYVNDYHKYVGLLSENLRQGEWRPWLDGWAKIVRETEIRQKTVRMETSGTPAHDFTLVDVTGQTFTLSKLPQDKIIVLDFWGTWCKPCIQGMPRMKEFYAQHHDRVEFVSIACNDEEKRWKNKVKDLELPWINLLNDDKTTENNVPVHYGVMAYPTKFILAPDKRILYKFEGEGDAFYEKLEELLK